MNPILHPDYTDKVLTWINEGNLEYLTTAFGNFTHEIAVRVSEDADSQWFPHYKQNRLP